MGRNDLSVLISISKYLHIEIFILVIITNTNTRILAGAKALSSLLEY